MNGDLNLPVVIFGDSRQPALRHEIPTTFVYPVLFLEAGGRRMLAARGIEVDRMRRIPGIDDVLSFESLGIEDLLAQGESRTQAMGTAALRACLEVEITEATCPPDTDAFIVDALRGGGVRVTLDEQRFELRRRTKTPAEIEGAERAQRSAQEALEAVREVLREDPRQSSESLRAVIAGSLANNGAIPHEGHIVACGAEGADHLNAGTGPIEPSVPILVDIFPRDLQSGCWGDLTRTLCVGEAPEELIVCHREVREAQERVMAAVRPGVTGGELHQIGCEYLESRGYRTPLGKSRSSDHDFAVRHLLGHGVGLELIEPPTLDRGGEELVAGDVITIEPAVYRPGFGGCRLEDLVLVTDSGCRNLTDCPYDLEL